MCSNRLHWSLWAQRSRPGLCMGRLGKISQRGSHLSRDIKVKNVKVKNGRVLAGAAGVGHKSGRGSFQHEKEELQVRDRGRVKRTVTQKS